MLLVEVDLIVGSAKAEPDRALGVAAVNVVYVQNLHPLSQCRRSYSGLCSNLTLSVNDYYV